MKISERQVWDACGSGIEVLWNQLSRLIISVRTQDAFCWGAMVENVMDCYKLFHPWLVDQGWSAENAAEYYMSPHTDYYRAPVFVPAAALNLMASIHKCQAGGSSNWVQETFRVTHLESGTASFLKMVIGVWWTRPRADARIWCCI